MRPIPSPRRSLALLPLLAAACGGAGEKTAGAPGEAPPAEGAVTARAATSEDAEQAALAQADAAADQLGGTLKARLMEAMGKGGPAAAIRVCADDAQALTAQVAQETGVQVGRSSLRLRNPKNAPPPWVEEWLKQQGERPAEGVAGMRAVVQAEGGKVARVLRPIAVEGPCLNCHGPEQALAPEIRKVLEERYPEDQAKGYQLGDLRGALWAEVKVGS